MGKLQTCPHEKTIAGLAPIIPSLTLRASSRHSPCCIREGLPTPREPAYGDKRSQDGEAQSTSE